MSVNERDLVSKPFNTDDPTPVDVVVERLSNGAIVEYPKPSPRIALVVDKAQIIADGVDSAVISASFEDWALVPQVDGPAEGVWSKVVPTGDVTFSVNLRETVVAIDTNGVATLSIAKTTPGVYRIKATCNGYGEAYASVEALA